MNTTHMLALTALTLVTTSVAMAAPSKTPTPASIVGKWRWSVISPATYKNPKTGELESEGSASTSFAFTKDGLYKYKYHVKLRTSQMVNEASTSSEGTVIWGNGTLTLQPTKGHLITWYGGRKVADRPMTATERRKNTLWYWKWQSIEGKHVITNDGKPMLLIGLDPQSLSYESGFKREI